MFNLPSGESTVLVCFFGHLTQVQTTSIQPTCAFWTSFEPKVSAANWLASCGFIIGLVYRNGISCDYPEMPEWFIRLAMGGPCCIFVDPEIFCSIFFLPSTLGVLGSASPNMTPAVSTCECCAGSVPTLELKVIFDLKTSPCPSAKSRLHYRGWGGRWVGICLHCAAFRVANGRDGPWRLHFLCQSTVATCSRERCGDISREQIVHQFLNCSLFCLTFLMDLDDFGGWSYSNERARSIQPMEGWSPIVKFSMILVNPTTPPFATISWGGSNNTKPRMWNTRISSIEFPFNQLIEPSSGMLRHAPAACGMRRHPLGRQDSIFPHATGSFDSHAWHTNYCKWSKKNLTRPTQFWSLFFTMGACTMWLSQNLGWFLCLDFLWELVRHDISRSFWGPPSEKDKRTYPKDPKKQGLKLILTIPYIGLIYSNYSRYLQFRSLKWPLTKTNYQTSVSRQTHRTHRASRSLGLANQQTMDPRWYGKSSLWWGKSW